jgi:hypothetical protein
MGAQYPPRVGRSFSYSSRGRCLERATSDEMTLQTIHPGRTSRTAFKRGLNELRDNVRSVLDPLLADVARDVFKAVDGDPQSPAALTKSAARLVAEHRAFAAAFFAALDKEIERAAGELLNGPQKEPPAPSRVAPGRRGLALVGYDQMEEEMKVDRVASRILNAAEAAFTPLTQRLATVLNVPAMGQRDNPIHPLRFCRALCEAIDKAGISGDERHPLLEAFEAAMLKPLVQTYTELNRQLEQRGVEEVATVSGYKNTGAGFRATKTGPARNTQVGPAPGAMTGTTAEQLLSALYHRMQVQPATGMARAAADGVIQSVPLASAFEYADPVGQAGLPRGFGGPGAAPAVPIAPGAPVHFSSIDPPLLASINEVQRLNAIAAAPGIQGSAGIVISARDELQLRQRVSDKATRQIDKLTVELVGMLFDRIHRDRHIPVEIKVALSRLQFPIMKVALADAELFVSPVQPARRLMDRIASTAIGWMPDGEENVRYLAEVNKAINTVLVAIEEGPAIFERALEEFERYLGEERERDDNPVTRAKRALEEAETREVMAINAAIGIRRAFEGVLLESYLRDFLLEVWVRVLVAATLKERSQPDFSRKFRRAVAELVWSVQPKINLDDRKRLVKTIPAVLSTLREGLQLINLPAARAQEFFSRLMTSHAQAVKALEVAYGAAVPVDARAMRRRIDDLQIVEPPPARPDDPLDQLTIPADAVHSAAVANDAEVNVIEEPQAVAPADVTPTAQLSDASIDAMIESWQRGSWFDLWTGQQTERVRLRWISPRRNFYLFTSAETGKAHSLAPIILRSCVRTGRIRPAESAPLFERAVSDLMRDLQGEGEAVPA